MTKKETRVIKIGIFIFLMNLIFTAVAIRLFISAESNANDKELTKDYLNATKAASGIQAVLFVIGVNCPPGFTPYTAAEGRFILGAANGDQVTGGTASHTHSFSGGTDAVGTNAGAGGGNQGFFMGDHAHGFSGTTNGPNNGLPPYVRLKPCVWQHN